MSKATPEPLFTLIAKIFRWIFKTWIKEVTKDVRKGIQAHGEKTAKQLAGSGEMSLVTPSTAPTAAQTEALLALRSMGWKKKMAEDRVAQVSTEYDTDAAAIVVRALRRI